MQLELGSNRKTLWAFVFTILLAGSLHAQDITGNWQGTLAVPQNSPLRIILKISGNNDGVRNAKFYSIDQTGNGYGAAPITVYDPKALFVLNFPQASYEGKLSEDGNSIVGTWVQGSRLPLNFEHASPAVAWPMPTDPSSHSVQFVTVEPGVKLEVLDWGGTGRPLVFLAGLGDSAHAFDKFAPEFVGKYHVYGITRRGFGESSYPTPNRDNYLSDRLGDDVLATIAVLNLQKPVLVGHSIAGEELSSIGSRHPEKICGLIYLDPGYSAFYDRALGDTQLDMLETRDKIEQLLPFDPTGPAKPIEALLDTLPQLEKDLQRELKRLQAIPPPTSNSPPPPSPQSATPSAFLSVFNGEQKYTEIKVPALAIFAVPHDSGAVLPTDPAHHAAAAAFDLERSTNMANGFATVFPSAKVVRLPNANHYVFRSNEADVIRAMNDFLDKLPQP